MQCYPWCSHPVVGLWCTRKFKGVIRSLFDSCVNAMGQRPYWLSRMEASYYTFRFGTNIQRDLRTLSLPCDSVRDNHYACVIEVQAGKAAHACLAGLATKKSGGTKLTSIRGKMAATTDSPLNFLGGAALCILCYTILHVLICFYHPWLVA